MHLDTLVGFLADCAQKLPQPVTDDLQRAHTLKGSASMAGILPVAEIASPLEKLVGEFKSQPDSHGPGRSGVAEQRRETLPPWV